LTDSLLYTPKPELVSLNSKKYRSETFMRHLRLIGILCLLTLAFSSTGYAVTFYSQIGGDPAVLGNWNDLPGGGGAIPANFTGSGDIFVIQNGNNMATAATTPAWTLGATGSPVSLTVETGGTLQANGQVILQTGANFVMQSGATYIQNNASSMTSGIFAGTENFDVNSNFEVRTASSSYPGGSSIAGGGYGNFIVNLTGASATAMTLGSSTIVKGNMTVQSAGTQPFAVGGSNITLTVNGNYTHTAGTLRVATGTSTGSILQVNGNFSNSGGTFDMCGTTGATSCSVSAYGDLRVKGNFTVSGAVATIARSGSGIGLVVLNGTTNQDVTLPAGFAFGSNISFVVAAGAISTLQSNLTTSSLTQPGVTVLGTLNSNAKTISAGKINVACRNLSPCNNASGQSFGSTGILNLAGGSIVLTNSNTMDVYGGGTLNATNAVISYNNSSLSGMTVSGTATLTDTTFASAGATLAPLNINSYPSSPVSFGTVNIRGASTVSVSGISTVANAVFNWTDTGSFTSLIKNNSFVTSGTLTLGTGGVANSGTFTMNGTGFGCNQADTLLLRSSVPATSRPWTGAGTFTLTDVDIQDQNTTPAVIARSSTDSGNNTGFTFGPCVITAADASVRGRLLTPFGRGLANATVILTNTNSGEVHYARSTTLGYFNFQALESGDFYIINVNSKRYRFNSQSFTLNESIDDLVLTGQ
jgi:Carboxypeptidase regulatory-like domain